jgi:hypothetical protein
LIVVTEKVCFRNRQRLGQSADLIVEVVGLEVGQICVRWTIHRRKPGAKNLGEESQLAVFEVQSQTLRHGSTKPLAIGGARKHDHTEALRA